VSRAVCAWALAAALAMPARASELTHVLVAGETLGSLASWYYGASWKSVYILTRNGIANDGDIAAGTRLVIPTSFTYRVRRGDSLADIAKRFLGDRDRYKAVMQENGLKDPADLAAGAVLLMPFHLRYVVESGDSWSRIAQRFYRTSRKGSELKDYNPGVDALDPGDRVTVPIFDRATLDALTRKPPPRPTAASWAAGGSAIAVANSAGPTHAGAPAADHAALLKSIDDYKHGEFEAACPKLEQLLAESGFSPAERALTVSYLGFCAVAAGDREAASDYFRKWLEIDPKAQLDPVNTSPKILSVFQEVVESVHGGQEGR
jgi:LysM repeat protein